ncbi:MAG TPA: hypothetical protein VEW94_06420 [Chloroflexia bacterium]|nr:hypothetical protein [Chloroflexia bacterium]
MPGLIGLAADTQEATLSAGEVAVIQITITNGGYVVDAFDLTVRGIDPTWYTLAPARVSLFPHAKATVTLQLHAPAQAMAFAGDYAFEVVATSRDAPTESESLPMRMFVAAQGEIALSLEPQRIIARKGNFRLQVTNDGNKERTLVLRPSDPEELLVFAFGKPTTSPFTYVNAVPGAPTSPDAPTQQNDVSTARAAGEITLTADEDLPTEWTPPNTDAPQGSLQLTVPAATRVELPLQVQTKKRIWRGPKLVPLRFNVMASPPGVEWEERDVRRVTGELSYRPILAAWAALPLVLRRVLLILLVLALLALLLYLLLRPRDEPIVAGSPASQTATALAASAAATQTAAAGAALTAQAAAAQTATAAAAGLGNSATQTAGAVAASQTAAAAAASQTAAASVGASATQTAIAAGINGPVRIVKFDWVSPIDASGIITVGWEVTNTLAVTISGTPVPRVGTMTMDTNRAQALILTATDGVNIVSQSKGVIIVTAPRIASFTADPTETCPNCPITLRWTTERATRVLVDGTPVPEDQVASGSIRVTPTETTEYLLTAENAVGQVDQIVRVTVTAGLPTPTP